MYPVVLYYTLSICYGHGNLSSPTFYSMRTTMICQAQLWSVLVELEGRRHIIVLSYLPVSRNAKLNFDQNASSSRRVTNHSMIRDPTSVFRHRMILDLSSAFFLLMSVTSRLKGVFNTSSFVGFLSVLLGEVWSALCMYADIEYHHWRMACDQYNVWSKWQTSAYACCDLGISMIVIRNDLHVWNLLRYMSTDDMKNDPSVVISIRDAS